MTVYISFLGLQLHLYTLTRHKTLFTVLSSTTRISIHSSMSFMGSLTKSFTRRLSVQVLLEGQSILASYTSYAPLEPNSLILGPMAIHSACNLLRLQGEQLTWISPVLRTFKLCCLSPSRIFTSVKVSRHSCFWALQ